MDSAQAAKRVYTLRKAAKAMLEEADELVAAHFTGRQQDTYVEGDLRVIVGRNARFNAALAKKVLTKEQYESILDIVPSGTLAKEVLPPAVYKETQKVSDNKVTIELPKEED